MNNYNKIRYHFFMYVRESITSQIFHSFIIKQNEYLKYILSDHDYRRLLSYNIEDYEQIDLISSILFNYFKEDDYRTFHLIKILESTMTELNNVRSIIHSLKMIEKINGNKNDQLEDYILKYAHTEALNQKIIDRIPEFVVDTKNLIQVIKN